ncbi:MAG: hypothetical protein PHH13_04955 [Candidatus Peribacteraceae bacterium]|nr:hypothetical protein [Candidatus Peribacteraceae bacterium]
MMKLHHHFFAGFAMTLTAVLAAAVFLFPTIRSGALRASTPPFSVVIQTDLPCGGGTGISCTKYGNPRPARKIWECTQPDQWTVGTCTYTQVASCNSEDICPYTYVCNKQNGRCEKKAPTPREPTCKNDTECNGQVCVNGKCWPCTTYPFECEGDLICNAGLCEERPPQQEPEPECTTNAECGGKLCIGSKCVKCNDAWKQYGVFCPVGTTCGSSDGICYSNSGTPVTPPTNQPDGAACGTDSECASSYCSGRTAYKEGRCATDNRCQSTNDCEAKSGFEGTVCVVLANTTQGQCLSCTKTGRNSCLDGKFCSQITQRCKPRGTKKGGESCRENEECASNYCAGGIKCNPSTTEQEEWQLNSELIAAQARYDVAAEALDEALAAATEAQDARDEAKDAYTEAKDAKTDAKQAYLDARAAYKAADSEDKADMKEDMDAAKADYLEAAQAVTEAKADYVAAKTAFTKAKAVYTGAKRTAKIEAAALKAAQKAYDKATE